MKQIHRDSKRRYEERSGDAVESAGNCADAIVSLATPYGNWECVVADAREGDRLSKIVEPVLAWGLTVGGDVIPVTPLYPAGVIDRYALRLSGFDKVYSGEGSYPTASDWLDMETRRARRLGEAPESSV